MRLDRHVGLFFCLLVCSGSCVGQVLHITLYNTSGYDLDSLVFEKQVLGPLPKDSVLELRSLRSFTMQGMVPLFRPYAHINGKDHPQLPRPCGTKSRKVKSGTYAFDIKFYEDEHGYRLYWEKHEHSTIRR
ncbi:MAG: hypothetical protein ACKORE_03285 [Bacteroidota bacterium]